MPYALITCLLAALSASADGAREPESKNEPTDVVRELFTKKITDDTAIEKHIYMPSAFVAEVRRLREFLASDRRPLVETLFTIRDGSFAVVAIGIRGERYRHGIDIDPVFLIDKNGWKMLAERDDPRYRLDAAAIGRLQKLESQFKEKKETAYAAIAKKRAKPLDVSVDNLHGIWHQMGSDKLTVLNLGRNGKFAFGHICDGKLLNLMKGKWAIEDSTLVLASGQQTEQPTESRFIVTRITVDQLVTVSKDDRSEKLRLSRITDAILRLFPDLRVPQKQISP